MLSLGVAHPVQVRPHSACGTCKSPQKTGLVKSQAQIKEGVPFLLKYCPLMHSGGEKDSNCCSLALSSKSTVTQSKT